VSYVRFFDGGNPAANLWQVTQQVTNIGSYTNRYDVTILCNGLPVVQVELKRRGLELKEAFNQVLRYKKHSFWANGGLFQYCSSSPSATGEHEVLREQPHRGAHLCADLLLDG
jgi:type I restriction enzyme R subunit